MIEKKPAFGKPWQEIDPAKSAAHWRKLAAAEELYDALAEAEALVARHGGGLSKPWEQWLAKAKAALQKAEGGAI